MGIHTVIRTKSIGMAFTNELRLTYDLVLLASINLANRQITSPSSRSESVSPVGDARGPLLDEPVA